MNIRNNKGYTGIDLSIALIIIIIFIPMIFGVIYSIQKNTNSVNRKSEALSIATEILEIAKSMEIPDVRFSNNEVTKLQENITNTGKYVIPSEGSTYGVKSKDEDNGVDEALFQYIYADKNGKEEHYKITVDVDYPENEETLEKDKEQDYVRKVTVKVEYQDYGIIKSDNNTKSIEINTLLKKSE